MTKKYELLNQVYKVINVLEKDYSDEIKNGVFESLYKRYNDAIYILENKNHLNEINIIGGVRAYMDSFNDYQNPLLEELAKAEAILKELL